MRSCPIPWYMIVKGWFSVLIFHYYALTSDAFSSIFQGNPVFEFYFDIRPARTITRSTLSLHFPRITYTSFDACQTRVCQTHRRHTSRDTSVVNVNFNIGVVRRFLFSSCYGETLLLVMPLHFLTFLHKALNVVAAVSCSACNSNYSPCSK